MSEMIIENESAIQYFNQEAEKLLNLLTELTETAGRRRLLRSVEEEVFFTLDESKIKYSFKVQMDHEGNEISRYFFAPPDKWIGLDILNYSKFKNLLNGLYKRKEIKEVISDETLTQIIFYWMKTKYEKNASESLTFIDYLSKSIKERIYNFKISIPISYIAIDKEFEIGNVKFEFLRKELFDNIEHKLKEGIGSQKISENNLANYMSKLRKDYQGNVVATINVIAGAEKAKEVAEREVDKAIMAIKYYSPSAFSPRMTAIFGRKGIAQLQSRHVFVFSDDIPTLHKGVIGNQSIKFNIDNSLLVRMKRGGLDRLSELLMKTELSEFEELLFTALHTFTKAISYSNYHEKIVFILSALEIIFLKDSNEPIQLSIGQGLGFLVYREPAKRKEVVSLIKSAYKIRSNFIHHGQEKEDYDILRKLQVVSWKVINLLIRNHSNFKNKQEFISFVENLIYS